MVIHSNPVPIYGNPIRKQFGCVRGTLKVEGRDQVSSWSGVYIQTRPVAAEKVLALDYEISTDS